MRGAAAVNGAILATVGTLFAIGAAAIAMIAARNADRAAARTLWSLYGLEVAVVASVLVPAIAGPVVAALALAALAVRGQHELFTVIDRPVTAPARAVAHATAIVAVVLATGWGAANAAVAAALGAALSVAAAALSPRHRREPASLALPALAVIFPGAAAAAIGLLLARADGFGWLFFAFAVAETHDSFAFIGGRAFGRRPLVPRLSPGKTVEGALCGVAAAVGCALVVAVGILGVPIPVAVGAAVVVIAGAIAGDLGCSAVKRAAGVKDFPALAAPLGGALDIYDSLLAAGPALLAFLVLTGA